MAQQIINVGASPNDGDGNPIRTAFIKCNDNFSQLYSRAQVSPPPTLVGSLGDEAGMYAYDSVYFYYCFADYDGSSVIWGQVTQVGNISVNSIINGTSNVSIANPNGNVTISVNGAANVATFTATGLQIPGLVSVTGNVSGDYILGNGALLTGLPATYGNSNVADYLPTYSGNIGAGNIAVTTALTAGTVSTTGNILSAALISTSGNIASQGTMSATGNISTAGYFVGNFAGNISGNFVVPGSNTQVLFNTNGNADAVAGFTFDTNGPNLLTVLGTISSQGNVVAGNISTSNVVTATGNVTGGNLITAGQITATGNAVVGNVVTAGLITATGNVTGGNLRTAGAITATGNIITSGLITATGNVSGNYLRATTDVDAGGNVTATAFTGTTVSASGNITGANFRTTGLVTATGNVIGGNFVTTGTITATGNITGNYFIGNGSQLTGLPASYGDANVVSLLSAFGSNTISTTGTVTAGNITGGNILTSGLISGTGNVTAGNVVTAGIVTATGNIVGGNVTVVNSGEISTNGNVTGGTLLTATLITNVGNGGVAILNGGGNGVGNIGNATGYFNTIFATATTALYADLAESYLADAEYAPGTVVELGGAAEITECHSDMSAAVAGVVSTKPAYLMNSGLSGQYVTAVALIGRVPCKVQGPVNKGDLLVSAGNGRARAESAPAPGTIVGKAIGSLTDEFGTVEILVGRV